MPPPRPDSEHIKQMEAMLAENPRSLVFAQLADAYRRGGRPEDAIEICQQGLTHHVNYASAYMVLGRSYKEQGDLPRAREAFQRVLDLDAESVLAYHFLGEIAEARGEIPEALTAYKAALLLHPFDKEVRRAVDRLKPHTAAQAIPPEPLEDPHKVRPLEPELPTAATVPPEAPKLEREAPPHDPEPLATETLADLYAAQGLYGQAAEIYARVLADTPARQDLAQKHQDALGRAREAAGREPSASVTRDEALNLLEAWRDAFTKLREDRQGSTGLLESWRDAFRKLKDHGGGHSEASEVPHPAFANVEVDREEPVELLEAWRDAFRRLKTARETG